MDLRQFEELQSAVDGAWLAQVLQEMVAIRSENPFDEPPSPGYREQEMAEYLTGRLADLGIRAEWREVRPGRPNVFGYLPGREGHFTLALAGHTDTARTTNYPDAYNVRFEDGKVYGRGACDMKAGLAAYLAVAKALQESKTILRGNLLLCFNVDEEYQMLGSKAIGREGPRADQGIIGEPTSLAVCPANKGRVSTKI
ncbi:MAG: M20 family metallopeptidase, partial [Anaerolineae bacterium]